MNWSPDCWIGPKKVETPEISRDIAKYCGVDARDRLCMQDEPTLEKLIVLAERLEFVEHLTALKQLLAQRKEPMQAEVERADKCHMTVTMPEKLVWYGYDFAGLDYDLEALMLYLLLTCIDTIKGQLSHPDPFAWLIARKKCFGRKEPEAVASLLDQMRKMYRQDHGARRRFIEAFTCDLAESKLREELANSFAVVSVQSGQINAASGDAWEQKSTDQRLKKIADQLYSIRSRYTHTSMRTFFPSAPVSMIPGLAGRTLLQRRGARSLAQILREVIRHLIRECVLVNPK